MDANVLANPANSGGRCPRFQQKKQSGNFDSQFAFATMPVKHHTHPPSWLCSIYLEFQCARTWRFARPALPLQKKPFHCCAACTALRRLDWNPQVFPPVPPWMTQGQKSLQWVLHISSKQWKKDQAGWVANSTKIGSKCTSWWRESDHFSRNPFSDHYGQHSPDVEPTARSVNQLQQVQPSLLKHVHQGFEGLCLHLANSDRTIPDILSHKTFNGTMPPPCSRTLRSASVINCITRLAWIDRRVSL